jgi:hypothetical protein
MKVFSSSVSQSINGNTFGINYILRDLMFLPLKIGADQNTLDKFFLSAFNDISPWIALDLGSDRTVSAVQISQDVSLASSGNHFYFINKIILFEELNFILKSFHKFIKQHSDYIYVNTS